MAVMLVYDKNPLKIFSFETRRLISFKFGIQNQGLGPHTVSSNDVPVMNLNYFTARSTLLPSVLYGENAEILNYRNYWSLWTEIWYIWVPEVQGHSDLYFQTYSQTDEHIKKKFHVEPLCSGERNFVQMMEVTWSGWLQCLYVSKSLNNFFSGMNQKAKMITVGWALKYATRKAWAVD